MTARRKCVGEPTSPASTNGSEIFGGRILARSLTIDDVGVKGLTGCSRRVAMGSLDSNGERHCRHCITWAGRRPFQCAGLDAVHGAPVGGTGMNPATPMLKPPCIIESLKAGLLKQS